MADYSLYGHPRSGNAYKTALMLALAFPLGWGSFELIKYRKFNFIALLGLVSVLLTGGIGLLKLDNQWLAIKEAAIPGIIGIAVLVSTRTRFPLIRTMLFNKTVLNVDKIHERLEQAGNTALFETRLLAGQHEDLGIAARARWPLDELPRVGSAAA